MFMSSVFDGMVNCLVFLNYPYGYAEDLVFRSLNIDNLVVKL